MSAEQGRRVSERLLATAPPQAPEQNNPVRAPERQPPARVPRRGPARTSPPPRRSPDTADAAPAAPAQVPTDLREPGVNTNDDRGPSQRRRLVVTRAADVAMRRVRWLWDRRVVLGGLTLLAGREGLGKSTIAVALAAAVTRGTLAGEHHGTPRTVVYVHTEDARDYTIVPRLVAAEADLGRVIFVDAVTPQSDGDDLAGQMVLPLDGEELAAVIREHDVALVILDAATSVIDGRLDGDKDRQMRIGLERIARIGQDTGAAMLGIVHFGKRESADTGKLILGSIAWSQVARSVLAVARDEDGGDLVVSGTKGNLGPSPDSLGAKIIGVLVNTPDGPADVGRIEWAGVTDRDARDMLAGGDAADGDDAGHRDAALVWLHDYLVKHDGAARSADVKREAKREGIAERTLERTAKRFVTVTASGFPRVTHWGLPDGHTGQTCRHCRSRATTEDNDLRARERGATGATGLDQAKQLAPPHQSRQSRQTHVHGATGGATSDDAETAALHLLTEHLGARPDIDAS